MNQDQPIDREAPTRFRSKNLLVLGALAIALVGVGCRSEMYDQPRYETFEASEFFPDGLSARSLVAGTVPRGWAKTDEHLYYGRVDGALAETFPFAMEEEEIRRGQDLYGVYCMPCHGGTGDANGMIVQRGMPQPPSFHSKRLREEVPVGHFFDVISRGYGAMYSYAHRIKPEDRWKVIGYIRALQRSQFNENVESLSDLESEFGPAPAGSSMDSRTPEIDSAEEEVQ